MALVTIAALYQPKQQIVVVLSPPHYVVPDDKELELWAFRHGEDPHSLGAATPYGTTSLPSLPPGTWLAVSLEPLGGSPTGRPTGVALYSTPMEAPDGADAVLRRLRGADG